MSQRNILYTGPSLEPEQGRIHPEPCIVPYGGQPSFPQPNNNHSILNRTTFNPQHLPENHGPSPMPHGITQYNNNLDHLHHPANNMFMTPGARVYPVAINHAMQEQLPFQYYMDVFKRKNAEGFSGNNNMQYYYSTPGSSSSSAVVMNTDGTMMDPVVGHRSGRNRGSGGMVDPVLTHSSGHLIPGNYGGQPIQAVVNNPWLDQPFCGNGNDGGAFSWNHGPGLPYLQGPINGSGIEAANVGLHGYQVTPSTRNPTPFVHPAAIQGPHNLHHPPPPMPSMQGPNMDFHSQLASTSRRLPTTTAVNPFIEPGPGPRFVGPTQPTGIRVFRPHRRELMVDPTARHRAFPHLRVLPEDGVAILDISGYHEVGNSVDQHRDMRLDIDHMSYEELLALGEQIGSAGSGLSDNFILEHLKTRVFASSSEPEDSSSDDQEINSCVICQNNYDDQEQIGTLDCGHEYHVDCLKKWLTVKNTCPVCKSTGLAAKEKGS